MKTATKALFLISFSLVAQAAPLNEARSYLRAGLSHVAFESLTQAALLQATVKDQIEALKMMLEIHQKNPALRLPGGLKPVLKNLLASPQKLNRDLALKFALEVLTAEVSNTDSSSSVSATLKLFEGSGPYQHYARGLAAAAQGRHAEAVASLERFLSTPSQSEDLKSKRETAQLLLARAHYALGNFSTAASAFAKVTPHSVEFPQSLIGRGWSELQAQHYPEALGAATNFEIGTMKREFQPEAFLIKAMGLNELCQYPASLRTVRQFQSAYRDFYFWLKKWATNPLSSQKPLYPLAILAAKGATPSGVPAVLAQAWVRSPGFLAEQNEIHALFREEALARAVLRRKDNAAIRAFVTRAPEMRVQATARINHELAALNQSLLKRLDSATENLSLVQVEIFNGASHDLIFRNANPKFAEASADWQMEAQPTRASRVWNWGGVLKKGKRAEIWQDEYGSLQAQLTDQCSNKKRYLQLEVTNAK